MAKILGRPQKYAVILWSLPDKEVFTPAKIAAHAEAIGLVDSVTSKTHKKLMRQRIRISMGRFANNHAFPDDGDGWVRLFGQSPTVGWYGWRWKAVAHPLDDRTYQRLETALAHLSHGDRTQLLCRVRTA